MTVAWLDKCLYFLFANEKTPAGKNFVINPHDAYRRKLDQEQLSVDEVVRVADQAGYHPQLEVMLRQLSACRRSRFDRLIFKLQYAIVSQKSVDRLALVFCLLGIFPRFNVFLSVGVGIFLGSRWLRYRLWQVTDEVGVLSVSVEETLALHQSSELKIKLQNRSKRVFYDVLVVLECPFVADGMLWGCLPMLQPRRSDTLVLPFAIDKGMGAYPMTELTISVSDALSLTTFSIKELMALNIKIAPDLQAPIDFSFSDGKIVSPIGESETQKEGLSCNFFQLRPWRYGDSVKRIHWSRSLRLDQLLVMSFESTAHLEANVLIDYRKTGHCDFDQQSSQIDLLNGLFGICQLCSLRGLSTRVITEHWITPMGKGVDHLQLIAHQMKQVKAEGEQSLNQLLQKHAHEFLAGSVLFLFLNTFVLDVEPILSQLYALMKNKIEIYIIAIDSTAYCTALMNAAGIQDGIAWQRIALFDEVMQRRSYHPEVLQMHELLAVRTFLLQPNKSIHDVMLNGIPDV